MTRAQGVQDGSPVGALRGVCTGCDDPTCRCNTVPESTPKALALLACIIATIFIILWVIA